MQVCIDVLRWRIGTIGQLERDEKEGHQSHHYVPGHSPRHRVRASLLWEIEYTAAVLRPTWWKRDRNRQILILANQARVKFVEQ